MKANKLGLDKQKLREALLLGEQIELSASEMAQLATGSGARNLRHQHLAAAMHNPRLVNELKLASDLQPWSNAVLGDLHSARKVQYTSGFMRAFANALRGNLVAFGSFASVALLALSFAWIGSLSVSNGPVANIDGMQIVTQGVEDNETLFAGAFEQAPVSTHPAQIFSGAFESRGRTSNEHPALFAGDFET